MSASPHPALRRGPLALFFVLFFVAMAAWSVATPVSAAPDEFEHAFRAYAAVRGDVYVKPTAAAVGTGGYVDVPLGWKASGNQQTVGCYASNPPGNPICLPPLTNDRRRPG